MKVSIDVCLIFLLTTWKAPLGGYPKISVQRFCKMVADSDLCEPFTSPHDLEVSRILALEGLEGFLRDSLGFGVQHKF